MKHPLIAKLQILHAQFFFFGQVPLNANWTTFAP
jgi:hypothetical protein